MSNIIAYVSKHTGEATLTKINSVSADQNLLYKGTGLDRLDGCYTLVLKGKNSKGSIKEIWF
ncbi:MAG TPA: hypothetical protein EYO73_01980 [Sulfurimonas sp.]|nr:hypothetical protein [Sulfurimonas sp.]